MCFDHGLLDQLSLQSMLDLKEGPYLFYEALFTEKVLVV